MSKKVSIIGAGGHSRSLVNLLERAAFVIEGIYDDSVTEGTTETVLGCPIKGTTARLPKNNPIVLAIGDNEERAKWYERYKARMYQTQILHPQALVESSVTIGIANQIFANAILNAGVTVGDNNIINTASVLEHETVIGSHNHISVATILCGRVVVGNSCFIGAGAVVIDKMHICDNVIVGANAVVIRDITEPGTYVGNPARKIA